VTGPQKGWTIGAVLGVFGAAAGAALLLGLDADRTAHALGIALSMAAGSQQTNVEQVLTKRLQPGLAARAGVQSALLAGVGITAPAQAFEGRFGLWSLYFPADPGALLADWGSRFTLMRTGLKRYPVCACSHAAIDALQLVLTQDDVDPRNIVDVEAVISPFMDRLVGGAFDPSSNPQVTAQFCLRYALAAILLRGDLGLSDLEEQAVRDPAIAALIPRIRLRIDPANTAELAPATVKVTLGSGRTVGRTVADMPGSASAPLLPEQRAAKYAGCLARAASVPPGGPAALESVLARLESAADMAQVAW
jgi:2-methylcitrate dehydratase PrpD